MNDSRSETPRANPAGASQGPQISTVVESRNVVLRPAEISDLDFLRHMLLEAAYWRHSDKPDLEEGLRPPHLAKLLAGWGRPGDNGVIAEADGRYLGAAWYRYWIENDHSYGYVAETIPEVAIGVAPKARGCGLGRMLMVDIIALAKREGVSALSLSVERTNPAQRLYRGVGFEEVAGDEGALTMLLRIKQPSGKGPT